MTEELQTNLLRLVPPILRAREFRLYTEGGGRLVDLWQSGGAAVLGHTPSGVLREVKNAAERGLFSAVPHPLERRFTKALARLFPQAVDFRVYAAGKAVVESLSVWRPFMIDGDPFFVPEGVTQTAPVLPWSLAPQTAVFFENDAADGFPPSDYIPPVILAGATRSIYDLLAAGSVRGKADFPKIQKALEKEKKENSRWGRQGIYLSYTGDGWAEVFRHFLDRGFLLPPDIRLPAILPGVLSPGEEAKLAELF